jgi:hypothetical protein
MRNADQRPTLSLDPALGGSVHPDRPPSNMEGEAARSSRARVGYNVLCRCPVLAMRSKQAMLVWVVCLRPVHSAASGTRPRSAGWEGPLLPLSGFAGAEVRLPVSVDGRAQVPFDASVARVAVAT